MIDLTPLEVRQKKGDFRRAFRGYDVELVNDFLDLVADRMEELVKENMALNDSVEALEQELADYREKETALSEALMAAQKLREDAKAHAEKEGELLIREAKADAEEARQNVSRALAREEDTLRQVRARRAQLVSSFRRLLERELNELAVIEESLELTAEVEEAEDRRAAGRPAGQASPATEGDSEDAGAAEPVEGSAEDGEGNGPARRDDAGPDAGDEDAPGDVQEDWLQSLAEE